MSKGRTKKIGLTEAVSIGLGGMIGAGIFSVMGIAAQIAGSAAFISFLIAGIIAFVSAYSFAMLGRTFPAQGGPGYLIIKGHGDTIVSGTLNLMLYLGYVFAIALYAKAFAGYAMSFIPGSVSPVWPNVTATGIVIVFTGINYLGAKAVGKSELFIVLAKVLVLIVFAALGLIFVKPAKLAVSEWSGISNIFFAAGIVFLSYEGFGLINAASKDMRKVKKNLPKAIYISILVTAAIYVVVALSVTGNLSPDKIVEAKDYALAAAAEPFLGQIGFTIIAIAALFSTASAINATLYGGANVSYTLEKNGFIPLFFIRKLWETNQEGLFLTSFLVISAVNFFNLEGIALMGSTIFIVVYGSISIGHVKRLDDTGANKYIVYFSIIVYLFLLAVIIIYQADNSVKTLVAFGGLVLFSIIFEILYKKYSNRILREDEDEQAGEQKGVNN